MMNKMKLSPVAPRPGERMESMQIGVDAIFDARKQARLAALREVREMVDSHVGIGKPRWEQGYNWMKCRVLYDIDAMIREEEGK